MHCQDIRELLGNYIDENLTETMRRRIDSHLAECASCAADLASLQTAVARLASAPDVEAPNAWHFERLLERLTREHDTLLTAHSPISSPLSQLSLNITDENGSL